MRVWIMAWVGLMWSVAVAFGQGPISGFMPERGRLTVAYNYSEESFDEYFGPDGEVQPADFNSWSHQLYVEYGLGDSLALVATLPYVANDAFNRNWQDASLWLKFRNTSKTTAQGYSHLVTAVGLSFPASNYGTGFANSIGRRATTFQGRLSWQTSSYRTGLFLQLLGGIDFQFAPQAQAAIPLLLRVGQGGRHHYIEAWLERYISVESVTDAQLTAGAGSTWTRAGATLYIPLRPWVGLNLGLAQMLGGRNIGQSLRWNAGVVFNWQRAPRRAKA